MKNTRARTTSATKRFSGSTTDTLFKSDFKSQFGALSGLLDDTNNYGEGNGVTDNPETPGYTLRNRFDGCKSAHHNNRSTKMRETPETSSSGNRLRVTDGQNDRPGTSPATMGE